RGLALRAFTTADAGAVGLGAGSGTQVMQLDGHCQTSSTVTRWRTTLINPRFCGVSSRTTDLRIPRRPRVRRVSRWFCLAPITLLIWVTLRSAIVRLLVRHGHAAC